MTIIEVRPSKKFKGAWVSFEAPGVEPAFAAPDAKRKAIDYACGRFGGSAGEVHSTTNQARPSRKWLRRVASHIFPLAVISAKPGARSASQLQSARAMQDGVRLPVLHFLQQLTDLRCGRRNDLDTALFPLR